MTVAARNFKRDSCARITNNDPLPGVPTNPADDRVTVSTTERREMIVRSAPFARPNTCRECVRRVALAAVVVAASATSARGEEFYQDFRGGEFDVKSLALVGQNTSKFVDLNKDGLRIVQSDPNRPLYSHGSSPRFKLQGDFEITVSFEILELPKPTGGYGSGLSLRVLTEQPDGNGATIARLHQGRDPLADAVDGRLAAALRIEHRTSRNARGEAGEQVVYRNLRRAPPIAGPVQRPLRLLRLAHSGLIIVAFRAAILGASLLVGGTRQQGPWYPVVHLLSRCSTD